MTQPESRSPLARLMALPSRTKLLIAVGVVLIGSAVLFGGCQGVEIERGEAVTTARSRIDFAGLAPEHTQARILRQGVPSTSQWVVVFSVNEPGGTNEDFLCHASVYVNAATGNLSLDAYFGQSDDACPWAPKADA